MGRISRRQVVRGAVAAAAMTLGAPSVHPQKGQQTLRFVAEADLKILDPIWTTAYITRNHGYLVYDTLFGTDENFRIRPQMVDRTTVSPDGMKYTFTLRDGLRWHDGQPVESEDCVQSLKRWGRKDRFGQLLMAHTGKIAPIEKKTFTIELAERFGPVLDALGKPSSNVPFMMPARIASTPPDEQIKEIVGSGPFKFASEEWQAGEQVVYLRNPDYIPRDETPSGSSGGKKVYLDKVIWRYMPDPWDAAEGLTAGELDWWQEPPLDFIPKIEQNPNLQTFVFDRLGVQGWLKAELPPPAVQQQEGARGPAPHDGPSDVSRLGCRTVGLLPALLFGICLRRPLRDEDRLRADGEPRPDKSDSAREGVGLRRPADRGPPSNRQARFQRRGNRHAPTARVDRLQGHPQSDGLVDEFGRAGAQGAT